VVAAPLLLGTIGGCGGKFFGDWIRWAQGSPAAAPSELSRPTFAVRSAALCAGCYYAAVRLGAAGAADAAAGVSLLLVGHALASELSGRPLDFSAPLVAAASAVLNLGDGGAAAPGRGARGAAAAPAAAARAAKRESAVAAATAALAPPPRTPKAAGAATPRSPKTASKPTRSASAARTRPRRG